MKSLNTSLNIAHLGCNPRNFMSSFTHSLKFFCPCTHISPWQPPDFYRSTPNHPHLDVLSTSICHASPHQPHSEQPGDCTNPHLCLLSFNNTSHIHLTIICSALSRLSRFSAFIAISQSHKSTWSGHMLFISCPLYDLMHHRLSRLEIIPRTQLWSDCLGALERRFMNLLPFLSLCKVMWPINFINYFSMV